MSKAHKDGRARGTPAECRTFKDGPELARAQLAAKLDGRAVDLLAHHVAHVRLQLRNPRRRRLRSADEDAKRDKERKCVSNKDSEGIRRMIMLLRTANMRSAWMT